MIEADIDLERVAVDSGQRKVVDFKEVRIADDIGAVLGVQLVLEDDRETRKCPGR